VAVAAVRGKLQFIGLMEAFADVCYALNMGRDQYCEELSRSPQDVAKEFNKLADKLEKEQSEANS
jgi:hypothetical protein